MSVGVRVRPKTHRVLDDQYTDPLSCVADNLYLPYLGAATPVFRLRYAFECHSVRQLTKREARYHNTARFRLHVLSVRENITCLHLNASVRHQIVPWTWSLKWTLNSNTVKDILPVRKPMRLCCGVSQALLQPAQKSRHTYSAYQEDLHVHAVTSLVDCETRNGASQHLSVACDWRVQLDWNIWITRRSCTVLPSQINCHWHESTPLSMSSTLNTSRTLDGAHAGLLNVQ
jgi:hypothetical protein